MVGVGALSIAVMTKVHERRDVAIMGAGAAGALLAARLAEAGKSVVVLEAGPAWQLTNLISSQIWARRIKWGGAPVLPGGSTPIGHNFNGGSGLGGAALHHYASYPRLHPADFTMASDHGEGLDWPIGYDDLRPHYDAVQDEVGISGDAAAEVWRPPGKPYPLPPFSQFAQAEMLSRGFAASGMRVAPMPMAILSQTYKGRDACLLDGWCDAGCPTGALANPLVIHLPAARKAGADIRTRVEVTAIDFDRGRADALRYVDAKGAVQVQPADVIILAGGAVQNARLLLAARTPDPSGLTGAWFNSHPVGQVYSLFEQETDCQMGFSAGSMTSQDDYDKAREAGPFGSVTWGWGSAFKPNDLIGIAMTRADLFGEALHGFMRRAARHLGMINAIVEGRPARTKRIELTTQRDAHGMPLARIVHDEDLALWGWSNARAQAITRAAGAQEVWSAPRPQFGHLLGGTIMGRDARASVTDSFGRLHAVSNLFAAGGGLFPTIGAVSPTFTLLALADRSAAEIVRNWGGYAKPA